jgi:hypothetical protein
MGCRTRPKWRLANLAGGTDKRATFTLEAANDLFAVVRTELTFFAIDKMAVLVVAFCTVWCVEVFDARSAAGNCRAQPIHFTVRLGPGTKEHFVRVIILITTPSSTRCGIRQRLRRTSITRPCTRTREAARSLICDCQNTNVMRIGGVKERLNRSPDLSLF